MGAATRVKEGCPSCGGLVFVDSPCPTCGYNGRHREAGDAQALSDGRSWHGANGSGEVSRG
jgi:hypothetical protein